jgi:hypothetical protein
VQWVAVRRENSAFAREAARQYLGVVAEPKEDRASQRQRILGSRTLRSPEVLKRLLDYLGRQAIEAANPGGMTPSWISRSVCKPGKLRQKLVSHLIRRRRVCRPKHGRLLPLQAAPARNVRPGVYFCILINWRAL